MSRSYKHTPIYKTTKAGNKGKNLRIGESDERQR